MLRRLPIESAEPAQLLAAFRLAIAAGSLLLTLALSAFGRLARGR